ncbi:sensor histidine kinase [Agromyces kandeliae]|uniref:histidine kinase n=1 Tax=Agromyces kandeliae TaxID=2666141 RepID=A0A6L5R3K1_9MICO|nr:sensor histidine kinase [Agromyces kandeliae]MRX44583.1 sensor histidine kinase [Agromyces kandeliae]
MQARIRATDIAIAAIVCLVAQLDVWAGIGTTNAVGPEWARSLAFGLAAALLVFRRAHPLGVLAGVIGVYLVEFAIVGSPEGNAVLLAPLVAIYTVGRLETMPRSLLGVALGVVLWFGWSWLDPLNATFADMLDTIVWLAPWVIAWLVGALVRTTLQARDQRRAALAQRESRAIAEERNRIARELHDVVGHSLSVMIVQAAAVRRRLAADQHVERTALEAVESAGREALTEMRRLVGVLRTDEAADREPAPGLGDLDRLAERVTAAGLPVSVSVTGEARELPAALDVTAYRLVQEGLTNALRHAGGASAARVDVEYGDAALRLRVIDDGAGPDMEVTRSNAGGSGLAGLRERVALYGGSLLARPHDGGGFELLAELPLEAA